MIDFLKSNAGIYTTATLGLLFQLAGVLLVVRDVMKAHAVARRFTDNMNVIEKARRDLQEDSPQVAREAANGDGSFAVMIRPNVETDKRARKVEMSTREIIGFLLSEVQLPNRVRIVWWRTPRRDRAKSTPLDLSASGQANRWIEASLLTAGHRFAIPNRCGSTSDE